MMNNHLSEEIQEEFLLLMSMALDGLLDAKEEQQFAQYQAQYPTLATQWADWQQLHYQMCAMPHAIPTPNFVDRFELRLIQQERRRRLRQGMWIGLLSLTLWIAATVGVVSVGTYLFVNQSTWMANIVHQVILFFAAIATWANGIMVTFNSFADTPQAVGLGIGYLVFAMAMLAGWFVYLRRSTHEIDLVELSAT